MCMLIKCQEYHAQLLKGRINVLVITFSSAYHRGLDIEDLNKYLLPWVLENLKI